MTGFTTIPFKVSLFKRLCNTHPKLQDLHLYLGLLYVLNCICDIVLLLLSLFFIFYAQTIIHPYIYTAEFSITLFFIAGKNLIKYSIIFSLILIFCNRYISMLSLVFLLLAQIFYRRNRHRLVFYAHKFNR